MRYEPARRLYPGKISPLPADPRDWVKQAHSNNLPYDHIASHLTLPGGSKIIRALVPRVRYHQPRHANKGTNH